MVETYALLVPLAVFAVLLLFRFVGCGFAPGQMVSQPYADDVLQDSPVAFYRLQEAPGVTTAADEMGHVNGQFGIAGVNSLPLLSGTDAATYFSQVIPSPSLELGAPSINLKQPGEKSARCNGGFMSTLGNGPLGDLARFTVDALVRPEWDIANERNFYCVLDYTHFVPGVGGVAPTRNAGFAIYAGPDNPFDPNSPICWQLWIGTGLDFARANPLDGSPGPLVTPENTYVAVQYDTMNAYLWAYNVNADVDQVKTEVIRRPFVPVTDPDPSTIGLHVGISTSFSGLFPPFPSPQGFIYPFVGRIADVAVYDTVLDGGRLMSHIMNSFNTTA